MKLASTFFNIVDGFHGIERCLSCKGQGFTIKVINNHFERIQCGNCHKMFIRAQKIERSDWLPRILPHLKNIITIEELLRRTGLNRKDVRSVLNFLLAIDKIAAVKIGKQILICPACADPHLIDCIQR